MENSETGKSDKYHIKSDKYHNIAFTKKKYVRFLIPDYDVIDLAGFKSSLPEKMFVIIVMKLNEFVD